MNRRTFCEDTLKLSIGLGALGAMGIPWRVLANETEKEPRFFVQFNVDGGWDTSLAMDPWYAQVRPDEKDFFIEYRHDQLLDFNGSRLVGPALAPLKSYFQRMTIFNGVFMTRSDGGHPSASLYARTGNGQGYLGLVSTELEGRAFTSPFGILANAPVYTGQSAKMIWDLNGLLRDGSIKNVDLVVDLPDANSELSQARSALVQNVKQIENFNRIYNGFAATKTAGHAIAASFMSGLSSAAAIETSGDFLDTHSGHKEVHLARLTAKFSQIREVLDILSSQQATPSKSLLDCTTVMITSEFTRTPALNTSQGKDHNPQCNSVLVMGPGMKPGVFGGSRLVTRAMNPMATSYLAGKPLDRGTYEVVERTEDAFILRPDSVVATIVQSMGCAPTSISEALGKAPVVKTALQSV